MTYQESCFGCLAKFECRHPIDMPHPYIGASGSCWEMYGHILVKEYSNPFYFKVHRITVDAYGAQHIGNQSDRRARQSAWVHLIALYLSLRKKIPPEDALTFLKKATAVKRDWPPQIQRQNPQWLTIQHVIKAASREEHAHLVLEWGQSVLKAYEDCQDDIVKLYENVLNL